MSPNRWRGTNSSKETVRAGQDWPCLLQNLSFVNTCQRKLPLANYFACVDKLSVETRRKKNAMFLEICEGWKWCTCSGSTEPNLVVCFQMKVYSLILSKLQEYNPLSVCTAWDKEPTEALSSGQRSPSTPSDEEVSGYVQSKTLPFHVGHRNLPFTRLHSEKLQSTTQGMITGVKTIHPVPLQTDDPLQLLLIVTPAHQFR